MSEGPPPPGGWMPPTPDRPGSEMLPARRPGDVQEPPGGWDRPPPAWPAQGPPPAEGPPNNEAVASLVLGITGIVTCFFTFGLLSLPLGVLGIIFGSKGRSKVERGETNRHKGIALAGWITSIVAVCLSVLFGLFILLSLLIFKELFDAFDDLNLPEETGPNQIDTVPLMRLARLVAGALPPLS